MLMSYMQKAVFVSLGIDSGTILAFARSISLFVGFLVLVFRGHAIIAPSLAIFLVESLPLLRRHAFAKSGLKQLAQADDVFLLFAPHLPIFLFHPAISPVSDQFLFVRHARSQTALGLCVSLFFLFPFLTRILRHLLLRVHERPLLLLQL